MRRYKLDLLHALEALPAPSGIHVKPLSGAEQRLLRRVSAASWAERVDSALARYAAYPLQCRTLRADVFHVLDHGYSQLLLGLPPSRTVVTCHDVIPLLAERGVIDMALPRTVGPTFRFRLNCMRRAARVIAVSEATKRTLVEYGGLAPQQIVVVHQGVNDVFRHCSDPAHRLATRRLLNVPTDGTIVLHVGTRGRYKNTPLLLRAIARLQATMTSPVSMVRVGSDFTTDEWELVDRLKLRPLIHVRGRVATDEELAELYRAADVLAVPSLWEGFGWPALEAMACGLPVVVSDRGSLPEVVGDAGVTVRADDDRGFAEAIARVVTDHELSRDLSRRGLQRARMFSWRVCAEKTLEVYRQVTG
jgi:glycosyltransferase involved in cell wall biosynthesis